MRRHTGFAVEQRKAHCQGCRVLVRFALNTEPNKTTIAADKNAIA